MVSFGLDLNLPTIVNSTSLEGMVFELIEWARTQGRVQDLIEAAERQNADNPVLRAFLNGLRPNPSGPPDPPTAGTPDASFDWQPLLDDLHANQVTAILGPGLLEPF